MFYLLHGLDDIHVIHVYVHKIKCSNFVVYKTPYFARSSVSTLTKSPARSFDVYIASINFFIIFFTNIYQIFVCAYFLIYKQPSISAEHTFLLFCILRVKSFHRQRDCLTMGCNNGKPAHQLRLKN